MSPQFGLSDSGWCSLLANFPENYFELIDFYWSSLYTALQLLVIAGAFLLPIALCLRNSVVVMAEAVLSSDMEGDSSPPRVVAVLEEDIAPVQEHVKAKSKTKHIDKKQRKRSAAARSLTVDKMALRRHQALEKQFDKARKGRRPASPEAHSLLHSEASGQDAILPISTSGSGQHVNQPNIAVQEYAGAVFACQGTSDSRPPLHSTGLAQASTSLPEASTTPTVAGLRVPAQGSQAQTLDLQAMVAAALANIFQAGLHQASQPETPLPTTQPSTSSAPPPPPQTLQGDTESAEEDYLDDIFSADDEMEPEAPTFQGLFKPSMFKALLRKARLATNMGLSQAAGTHAPSTSTNHEELFKVKKPEQEFVPFPDLFAEVIQRPWAQPGSLAGPNNFDKRLLCSAPELDTLLQYLQSMRLSAVSHLQLLFLPMPGKV